MANRVLTNKNRLNVIKNTDRGLPSNGTFNRSNFGNSGFPALDGSSSLGNTSSRPIQNVIKPEKDPVMELWEAYRSQMNENAAIQRAALEQRYNQTAQMLNKNYDNNANYAYVNYRQNQKRLPEELSNMGVSGGATESANIKLQNAYGTNLSNNEFNRNNDLLSARRDYDSSASAVDSDLNSQLASAYANFGLQSLEYKQAQKEKAAAKEEAAAIEEYNRTKLQNAYDAKKAGLDVEIIYGPSGKAYWYSGGNPKKDAEKTAKKDSELDKYNNAKQTQIGKLQKKGYDVYTWTDNAGKLHFVNLGKKKLTSSSGGSGGSNRKSGGSSGGGGSSSLPDVTNKNGSNNKSKPKINYSQAMSYFNQNIAKILGDPDSVVKDLNKKVKSGKMNEITSDYIMTKFPRKKTKGNRKKKG